MYIYIYVFGALIDGDSPGDEVRASRRRGPSGSGPQRSCLQSPRRIQKTEALITKPNNSKYRIWIDRHVDIDIHRVVDP